MTQEKLQSAFLRLAIGIALLVGALALGLPAQFLQSKGVAATPETEIWMRETGLLIAALGAILFVTREHLGGTQFRNMLIVNIVVQLGLLAIELIAFVQGTIPHAAGILPNSCLHVLLATGFAWLWLTAGRRRP